MTRPRPRASAKKEREIERRLTAAVEELLAQGSSFTGISVGRLIKHAGMSRSTFYVYFQDKEEVLRRALRGIAADIDAAVTSWWDRSPATGPEDLRTLLEPLFGAYAAHANLLAACRDVAAYDAIIRAEVSAITRSTIAHVATSIERCQRTGTTRPDLAPLETASWLVWMIERGQDRALRTADDAQREALIVDLSRLVWNTLHG